MFLPRVSNPPRAAAAAQVAALPLRRAARAGEEDRAEADALAADDGGVLLGHREDGQDAANLCAP